MLIMPGQVSVAIPATVTLPAGIEGDNCAVFLSMMALHTSLTPERRKLGHWINVHNRRLRAMLGGKYKVRIDEMRNARVVEVNALYSTGKEGVEPFTKSYRLAREHRSGKSRLHVLQSKPTRDKARKVYEIDEGNLRPAGMHYRQCFDLFRIDPAAGNDRRLGDHWYQWAIARWLNGEEFSRLCEYGRYHCLATQLPRDARGYVQTVTGEQIAVVDVSACQPLLLGILAARGHDPQQATLLPYGARFLIRSAPKDVQHWIELCETRAIYRHFYQAVQSLPGPAFAAIQTANGHSPIIDLKSLSENAFKRCTLIPVFDRTETMNRSVIFAVLRRDFPTIADFITRVKKERHQAMACVLQRFESQLMIDDVGTYLRDHHRDEPVQPIHDALLVRQGFADTAAGIIKDSFARLGVDANVKITVARN